MSGGVGGWASCDVPGVESGDVFGSVREKRLFAGDGALGENWASCSDRLGPSKRPEKPRRPRTGAASGDASRLRASDAGVGAWRSLQRERRTTADAVGKTKC